MRRFFVTLFSLTMIGLVIVYGEVEAVKIGYEIRQLNILRRELNHQLKEVEYQIASLTALDHLEKKMAAHHVNLVNPRLLKIAKASSDMPHQDEKSVFAKFHLRSAQASQ